MAFDSIRHTHAMPILSHLHSVGAMLDRSHLAELPHYHFGDDASSTLVMLGEQRSPNDTVERTTRREVRKEAGAKGVKMVGT